MSDRLFKRGAIWYCWVYGANRERIQRSTGCRDRKAAEAKARELERRAADPAYAAANETTVSQAFEQLLRDRKAKGRADGTLSCYQTKAGHFLRVWGAELPLARMRRVLRPSRQGGDEGSHGNA